MPNEKKNSSYNHNHRHHLKYAVCVSGAAETGHCAPDTLEKAEAIGRSIANHGMILLTGATTGVPYWAAKGAKEAGGFVVGFSPAASERAHLKTYHLPLDYHDRIIYTGFEYSGRNLLLIRSADAVMTLCGRMGTLNEFTISFEDQKPVGVLEGSGGTTNMLKDIIRESHRGPGNIIFEKSPETLVERIIELIEKERKEWS